MAPYNPNGIWTSKDNPNLPRGARSRVPSRSNNNPAEGAQDGQRREVEGASQDPNNPQGQRFIRPPRKRSFMSRYGWWVLGGVVLVLLAAAGTVFYLLHTRQKPAVSITIAPPSDISVGTPFVVSLSETNNSQTPLTNAVMNIELPQGVDFAGSSAATQAKEFQVGNLAPGSVVQQTSTLVVTGNPDTLYALTADLVYSTPQTPSTTYESKQSTSFSAGTSPVSLTYSAPTNIVSGQEFPIQITYKNTSAQPIQAAHLTFDFPTEYRFTTSSVPVVSGTDVTAEGDWNLGTLGPGQGGTLTATGTILGQANQQYQFKGIVSTSIDGRRYVINTQPANVALVPSPLSLAINVNGTSSYVAQTGDTLNYTLTYTNHSSVTMTGVKIAATLTGKMFNLASLQTSGAFDSTNDTIQWYPANTPALASLAPGQSGSVTFTIRVAKTFPIHLPSDKNYALNVQALIASPVVIPGAPGSSTVSAISMSNKVGGEMSLSAVGSLKSGPYPPRVNQPTVYRIDWTITNYSTNASSVTVSAYLGSGVSFLGVASSTETTSTPNYNPGTGLVTWKVPHIAAGTGIVTPPMNAEFTVSATPAVNQVGSEITLLKSTTLTASDTWTHGSFNIKTNPITTALPNDPAVPQGEGAVVQ